MSAVKSFVPRVSGLLSNRDIEVGLVVKVSMMILI